MFGMVTAESKRSATSNQPSSTRKLKKKILKVKSPASEGKFDASGASTFRATGDHFWIAVTDACKNNANMRDLPPNFLVSLRLRKKQRAADENVGSSYGAGASFRLSPPEPCNIPNRPRS